MNNNLDSGYYKSSPTNHPENHPQKTSFWGSKRHNRKAHSKLGRFESKPYEYHNAFRDEPYEY